MTGDCRRDKKSCAGSHRKRANSPGVKHTLGYRDVSMALAWEAKRAPFSPRPTFFDLLFISPR